MLEALTHIGTSAPSNVNTMVNSRLEGGGGRSAIETGGGAAGGAYVPPTGGGGAPCGYEGGEG